jgi:transposase
MSMPGIGPVTALALIAYTNGFKDFHSAGAVSAYVGLVPRIDHSGKTQRNGRIIQRCSTYLRNLLIQGAWSLVRCRDDNAIKAFYQRLALRVGSAKAIVATARKMVEVLYHMSLTETHFRPA